MPRGFQGVRKAAAELEARRAAGPGDGPRAFYFQLQPGEQATVRFLEEGDDITWCYVHNVPVDGRSWPDQIPCLDQNNEDEPCPGCEAGLDKKFKGFIQLIWFDGPVYKTDKDNRLVKQGGQKVVVDTEDKIALWSSGIRLFEELDETDDTYRGLRSRKFIVKRKGKGLDTKYVIKPEGGADGGKDEWSRLEKKLESEDSLDLTAFTDPPDYEEWQAKLNGDVGSYRKKNRDDDDDDERVRSRSKENNPFKKKR